jgi:hypothetical protein
MFNRATTSWAFALTLSAILAAPALAGPPWISAEYPVNPHHTDSRGALLLIHAFHHGTPMQFPVLAVAEGVVNGKRQSIKLEVKPTYRDGVFAVRGQLPAKGNWVLVVNLESSVNQSMASLIATVGAKGEVLAVDVPSTQQNGWTMPRPATEQDVDQALRGAVTLASARRAALVDKVSPLLAGLGLFGLLLVGATRRRALRNVK